MKKEATQYDKSRRELLDDPGFNPSIEGDEKTIDTILKEDYESLGLLIERIKYGEAAVKITKSKHGNKWKLEIFQKNNNELVYTTDIPADILMAERRIISAGLLPEYVEE